MNPLFTELDRYLSVRRSLGYDLNTTERVLRRFIAFADKENATHINTQRFLGWQKAFGHANAVTWSARLGIVRLFAQWLHGLDARHEVPPKSLIPCRQLRPRPYIYSPVEIGKLVQEAAQLKSNDGLRAPTYATLFGLIAVTGLRISEALALDVGDVDLASGVLTIRSGKGKKERLVPVADTTRVKLTAYSSERGRLLGTQSESFFVSDCGTRPTDSAVRYNFAVVCQRIGLRPAQRLHKHGRGPRIHDLRHTFAVRTMLNWYRQGKDAGQEMLRLTTYLGHAKPAHTYWYIEAVPELLELAAERSRSALETEASV